MDSFHTYHDIKTSPAFKGAPVIETDEQRLNAPLAWVILMKIRLIPMGQILWGKKFENGEIKEEENRQYEFMLSGGKKQGEGLMYLYIKKKSMFFKRQKSMKLIHGMWQKVPLTFKTLNAMSKEELGIIYNDLD